MSNLLTVIQEIAVRAVQSTVPVQYCFGTVTQESPLKIRINDGTIEISGDSILLTEPVVEKKITIQKHTHKIGTVGTHTHTITELPVTPPPPAPPTPPIGTASGSTLVPTEINAETTVIDTVLEAKCTEHGVDLPVDSNIERIVFTTNRKLEKGDKVLMMRVSSGQKFIVLSRIFEHD